jgi:large subunit ribosomal protein L29
MKVSEVRGLGSEEINARVLDLKAELAKERASIASGTRAENPGKIKNLRKTIARMFTVISERGKGIEARKKPVIRKEKPKEEKKGKEAKPVEVKEKKKEMEEEQKFIYSESKTTDIIMPLKKKKAVEKGIEVGSETEIIKPKKGGSK